MQSGARGLLSFVLVLVATLAWAAPGAAQPLDPKGIPAPLAPWTAWALQGKDDALCVPTNGDTAAARCAWPSRLALTLDEKGGTFSQSWHMDAKRWVALPGDAKRWPDDVTVDRAKGVVVPVAGVPSVEVPSGDHTIAGAFRWDSPPSRSAFRPRRGLLALTLRGAVVERAEPRRRRHGVAAKDGDVRGGGQPRGRRPSKSDRRRSSPDRDADRAPRVGEEPRDRPRPRAPGGVRPDVDRRAAACARRARRSPAPAGAAGCLHAGARRA